MKLARVLAAILLSLGACTYSAEYVPVSESATVGVSVAYELFTECGLAESAVDFDQSMWIPETEDPDVLHRVPEGLDSPFDQGTLELVEEDVVEFRSDNGPTFTFVRHDGSLTRRSC